MSFFRAPLKTQFEHTSAKHFTREDLLPRHKIERRRRLILRIYQIIQLPQPPDTATPSRASGGEVSSKGYLTCIHPSENYPSQRRRHLCQNCRRQEQTKRNPDSLENFEVPPFQSLPINDSEPRLGNKNNPHHRGDLTNIIPRDCWVQALLLPTTSSPPFLLLRSNAKKTFFCPRDRPSSITVMMMMRKKKSSRRRQ